MKHIWRVKYFAKFEDGSVKEEAWHTSAGSASRAITRVVGGSQEPGPSLRKAELLSVSAEIVHRDISWNDFLKLEEGKQT